MTLTKGEWIAIHNFVVLAVKAKLFTVQEAYEIAVNRILSDR